MYKRAEANFWTAEELDLSKEIKEVFLKFESKLVVNSIKDFKNKVSSDNTFFNRSLYGNSIKILDDYLKSKEIIYITYPFICCENGIILIPLLVIILENTRTKKY